MTYSETVYIAINNVPINIVSSVFFPPFTVLSASLFVYKQSKQYKMCYCYVALTLYNICLLLLFAGAIQLICPLFLRGTQTLTLL